MGDSAHTDRYVIDHLPPKDLWPELLFDIDDVHYPEHLNITTELLDKAIEKGWGDRVAIHSSTDPMTYAELNSCVDSIANVLVRDMGLKAGNRVLLRAPNSPMMAACHFAVWKAGGIVVATMPMLRASELVKIINKAQITHALVDHNLVGELDEAKREAPTLAHIKSFGHCGDLGGACYKYTAPFPPAQTRSDDPALLAFTSGTTGQPKACVHFHRDVLAMADTFSKHIVKPSMDDVFAGSPPLAFTFGLGGMLIFPLRVGAATVLDEGVGPKGLLDAIEKYGVTSVFTAPTAYRAMLSMLEGRDISSVHTCVSAGETMPKATSDAWFEATGIRAIDGIGATEMIHIFISASGDDIRPGATGKPVPGYQATILGDDGTPMPTGEVGYLAVKGPTGCRYLDDERQSTYVKNGWNVTGDTYRMDDEGYFWFVARSDDMIVSGGYNIAGPEVEEGLLSHPDVLECAVIGAPDPERGTVVKAFVVLKAGAEANAKALQDHVKQTIAPYKYPRVIEFIDALPKTQTGKVQRFKLREDS